MKEIADLAEEIVSILRAERTKDKRATREMQYRVEEILWREYGSIVSRPKSTWTIS